MEELGGLDRIEMLQNHDNDVVYQTAHALIKKYFGDVSEMSRNTVLRVFFFFKYEHNCVAVSLLSGCHRGSDRGCYRDYICV